jgi:hypothetical protein
VVGILAATVLTTGTTRAAFTRSTATSASFTAGSVRVTDDDAGAAVLDIHDLVPGQSGESCLTVTFSGDLPAMVPFYVSSSSGTLAPFVDLAVIEGSGGGNGSFAGPCGDRTKRTKRRGRRRLIPS